MADTTTPRGRRPRELARNLALLATTGARHLTDDPLLLAVQVARRLPTTWRAPLARAIALGTPPSRPGVRTVLAEFVADRTARAASLVARCAEPRTPVGRRLLGELAVALGQDAPRSAAPNTRARAAWNRGDISGAVEIARAGRATNHYAVRLESELETMQPGSRLAASPGGKRGDAPDDELGVLHLLTNSLPHTQSGYAIRSHAVLRAQREAGIDARAITRIGYPVSVGLPHARSLDVVDGVPYQRLLPARLAGTPGRRLQQMVDAALPLAQRHAPRVLHTTTNFTNALVTEALARSLGVPWIYEVRGVLEETWLASRHPSLRAEAALSERYALLRAKETELMLAADHVVVLSEVSRTELVRRGVPDGNITTVPNAIDARLLDSQLDPVDARRRLGLPAEGFWIGSVSSLVDYEGFDTLLEAVALLRRDGFDVRVALVGDGVSRPELLRLVADLGIGEAAVLPGRVPHEDAWLWHRALDAFAVPRRDLPVCREVTPLKPIEAMAGGRPIVASDLPALREIVHTPKSGLLATPGQPEAFASALARLLDSPELRDGYGDAGRSFAATRTWQRNAQIYRKVYQDVGVTE